MSIIKEFKDFAMRGNVLDLAVGVIIGGAFGKIVSSLVEDVIMPPIGVLVGGVNFTELKFVLKEASKAADGADIAAVTLNYGKFLQATFDFTIIAFAIFMMLRAINNMYKKTDEVAPEPAAPAEPVVTEDQKLLMEIRDLLKK